MSIDYKYDVRPGRRSQAKVLIFETDMDEGKTNKLTTKNISPIL